uniref:VWFA domain-containing protein n=1 Tax=Macrostomum lignano TaxID=282301 RepID=A0A1I8J6D2_9PLAT
NAVVELSGTVDANEFHRVGQCFEFRVTGRLRGNVWGSGIYTADSSLSKAAVHAGIVRNGQTKYIRVRVLRGRSSYRSTRRNGVKTRRYGRYRLSYKFIGSRSVPSKKPRSCPSGSRLSVTSRRTCRCAPISPGRKLGSLIFVIDITGSMGSVINSVKSNIRRILSANTRFSNYVVATFGDPYVRRVIKTRSITAVRNFLKRLSARGGGDCPEYAMSGALDAAKSADSNSVMLLFTDASAKDKRRVGQVSSLAKRKRIRVFTVESGNMCGKAPEFKQLARKSFGEVSRLRSGTFNKNAVVELSGTVDANEFHRVGQCFEFRVTGRLRGNVWGSGIYTADSSLSKAAVHAGIVRNGQTKYIRVRVLRGRSSYRSTRRNGVKTRRYGRYRLSYKFIGSRSVPSKKPRSCPSGSRLSVTSRRTCRCAPISPGRKLGSLIFVIDITGSMGSVINSVKSNIRRILSANTRFSNYVVATFGDPYVRRVIKTRSITAVRNFLKRLSARGGGDCPEYAMSGALDAAKSADSNSVMLLFTDASAKDKRRVGQVSSLAKRKRIRVFTVESGNMCGKAPEFKQLARKSFGEVSRLRSGTFNKNAVVELSGTVDANEFHRVGQCFEFRVTGRLRGNVWGSGIYTADSSLSKAAVHAGIVRNGQTKYIRVRVLRGRSSYRSTRRNGVKTRRYGRYRLSYKFIGSRSVPSKKPRSCPSGSRLSVTSRRTCRCAPISPGRKLGSLIFVIDITGSMGSVINSVKSNIRRILSANTRFSNYVVATFGDPYVRRVIKTRSITAVRNFLKRLSARGGGDCPEYAMSGALDAAKSADSNSVMLLFTDASAKDKRRVGQVSSLAKRKRIRVFTVESGNMCGKAPEFKQLARKSFGEVSRLRSGTFNKLMEFLRRAVKGRISFSAFPRSPSALKKALRGKCRCRIVRHRRCKRVSSRCKRVRSTPSSLSSYKSKVGQCFEFRVTGRLRGNVWGSGIYTADSSLSKAAVHAGIVRNGQTKYIRVRVLRGRSSYRSTRRNGVKTRRYGRYRLSYKFIGSRSVPSKKPRSCPSGSRLSVTSRRTCRCAPISPGRKLGSLIFVIDITGSMGSVINSVKSNIRRILSANTRFSNYVVATFGDPYVRRVIKTRSITAVRNFLKRLSARGGGDCPEYAMSGALDAAKSADSNSVMLLFTDASAKDKRRVGQVSSLAKRKRIRVFTVESGNMCGKAPEFKQLARKSFGEVSRLRSGTFNKLMEFLRRAVKGRISFSAFPRSPSALKKALRGTKRIIRGIETYS